MLSASRSSNKIQRGEKGCGGLQWLLFPFFTIDTYRSEIGQPPNKAQDMGKGQVPAKVNKLWIEVQPHHVAKEVTQGE